MRLPNICGLLTASALLIGANSANALTLTLDDLGDATPTGQIVLTDNVTPGAISFLGTVGGFTLTASTGFGSPARGGPGEAEIDLSVQTNTGHKGVLQVTLDDTGLSLPTGATIDNTALISDLGINDIRDAGVVVETFINIAGGGFQSLSALASPAVDLVETLRRTINAGDTFDLRAVITITHDNKFFSEASADANLNVAPIPLPAALPLFLTALIGLGFVGRQRRRQAA